MISPVTADAAWRERFATLPSLPLSQSPLMVIAPHPDDETLGAGALIHSARRQGIDVTVVAVTDGENAYDTDASECAALGALREVEQTQALAELGVPADKVRRLRMVDSGLSKREDELVRSLRDLVRPGMMLLAPWTGDFHPDHEACGRAAMTVAEEQSMPLLFYFFWTWHRGEPTLLDGLNLHRFEAGQDARRAKERALALHRSQLHRPGGDPILPEHLLGPARWPCEVFLTP